MSHAEPMEAIQTALSRYGQSRGTLDFADLLLEEINGLIYQERLRVLDMLGASQEERYAAMLLGQLTGASATLILLDRLVFHDAAVQTLQDDAPLSAARRAVTTVEAWWDRVDRVGDLVLHPQDLPWQEIT